MRARLLMACRAYLPGFHRLQRLPRQILRRSPFAGTIRPQRVPLFQPGCGRPSLPFPHPWNYTEPLRILETYFWGAEADSGSGRHNRYLEVPGFAPILVTRDPRVIRAITTETGDQPGQFDRDTLPSAGIARATGRNTLLYSNGATWRRQKKLSAPPFGKTTLFQPEQFQEFAGTFRHTVRQRLALLERLLESTAAPARVAVEPEVKPLMLEMLANNFFGCAIPYDEIRNRYAPALERVIDHIVRDTVVNKFGVPVWRWPSLTAGIARVKSDHATFENLTSLALAGRPEGRGLWRQFKSDAPDAALRGNIKVFLAGALEATTSYACWAISHLARNHAAQQRVFDEVQGIDDYTPANLNDATYLLNVLEETLRLTPSLYFLPRRATADTKIETADGDNLRIPQGTHVLLDVWHANRHEDHWGVEVTGHPAVEFAPERWESVAARQRGSKELLHFGFGHGPRVCPGKHLGRLEVALVVGAFVKLFRFSAVRQDNPARAGVSTRPLDGTLVELQLRKHLGVPPGGNAHLGSQPG